MSTRSGGVVSRSWPSCDDAEMLARFTGLHTIDLTYAYGLDAAALPTAA